MPAWGRDVVWLAIAGAEAAIVAVIALALLRRRRADAAALRAQRRVAQLRSASAIPFSTRTGNAADSKAPRIPRSSIFLWMCRSALARLADASFPRIGSGASPNPSTSPSR